MPAALFVTVPRRCWTYCGMTVTTSPQPPVDVRPMTLTLAEVALELRCTRRSIERQIAAGQLHVLRIGRSVRVELRELERFLESLRDESRR